jgi:hypothetical protein
MALSYELKQLGFEHFKDGKTCKQVLEIFLNRVSRRTMFRWFKEFKLSNECRRAKKPPGKPSRSIQQLKDVQRCMKFRKGIKKKVSNVSAKLNIARTTLRRRIKELDLKPYHKRRAPLLTKDHIKKRLKCVRSFRKLKSQNKCPILFSDEK